MRQLVLLFLGLLGIAGCGGGTSSNDAGPASGGAGSTLTVATEQNVRSVDPAQAYDTWSTAVVHAFTRRLVDNDADGKLVPDLAEKWDISKDGKTYTFHLRSDGKFSDGTPIDAGSFKAAIERVQDPKTASPGAGFYSGITAIDAPGPQELVVHLKAPDPTLLNVMGMTFAAPGKPGQTADKPPSSGPYELESFEPDNRVVLKKNAGFPGNSGWADRIVLQLRVDPSLQMTRFRSGEVDLLGGIPPAEYARISADPSEKEHLVQGVVNQTWYFGMNTQRPPWNNPKVRRAAFLAMNRQQHVDLAGAGQEANGILPPHVPGYDPSRKLPPQDVEGAKRLLAEAGYPSGVPESQKTVMWLANDGQYPRHAQAIQSDLRAVGIPVDLRPVTYSEYLTGYKREADCWYGGWYPDFPDAGNFLEPVFHGRNVGAGKLNAARYNNPAVDQLLDRAHGTPLGTQREALYRKAEDTLLQDLPWVPLYFEVETRYFQPRVSGVTVDPVWRQKLTGINKKP